MTSINFFTPVTYGNQPKTCSQSAREFVDNYFYLRGKKATVIDAQDPASKVVLLQKTTPCLLTCLKVITYLTLIIPLLFLITKAFLRLCNTFKIDEELTARLPTNTDLCDYYEKSGILRNESKQITIDDLETLNLDLAETESVNPDDFLPNIPNLPRGQITLREATTEVITQINNKIEAQATANTLELKRYIVLNDQAPGYANSSNIYFYSKEFGRKIGPDFTNQKNLWLNRICQALVDQGHIYKTNRPQRPGYPLQA